MLAGFEGRYGQLGVEVVWGYDLDGVHMRVVEKPAVVLERLVDFPLGRAPSK